ncbi:dihydrolipoyl dehydrogenase [Granulosicoccus antarcticus]|uniref:Dihydrolipoyl dehydrogenase n=1 Tax=Granulosicoccus antarcticus IMCC3135 TaxID=1192854 RepID=A0A2Z2NPL5_9GAMM|nr:dihydrolipoyl dehydrogenase [Granulosicoccus antarcticus]ASJ72405.1 Dihydrolipoyl dehydrogenase [Granulosicoccus antarcticus IMCC3135]
MSELETVKIPDIGDVDDVEIIEVLVSVGDTIGLEDSLITVESDKASMEIPSPAAGVITSLLVKTGDRVSEGSDILVLDVAAAASNPAPTPSEPAQATPTADSASEGSQKPPPTTRTTAPDAAGASEENRQAADEHHDLVVLGAGPGGYTAAFRAADLGLKVLLIERYPDLGGVCLNVGCIPSKALLHTAAIIQETQGMSAHGVTFAKPEIDIDKLRSFKEEVIGKLTGGLAGLAKQRKVTVAHGFARFRSSHLIAISNPEQQEGADQADRLVSFDQAIIAAGSKSIRIPGFPYDDERLMDSTGALELADIPKRLLVIGGGIIGLEMGCVYAGLGSAVTVVELSEGLMPGCDRDLVRPLEKRLKKDFENIFTGAKVTGIESTKKGLSVTFEGGKAPASDTFDRVLLAVGRSPNGHALDADKAEVLVDERGFIAVDSQQRTNVQHIFAIGDLVGQPMLAHKATHEGKVAAEVAAGQKSYFDAKTIPSVAYTDPEIAWMGLTETAAKDQGISYEKGAFPWAASGRALSMARSDGLTKVLYDPQTKRILGAGIVGPNAGELIAEAVLALEMGADLEDLALTIHPHPTLSETLNFAAEVAEGTVTDIYIPKR